ncbi:MAG TPA: hypothetical protein VIH66_05955, partial [Gammaproteobacteria bacterium]
MDLFTPIKPAVPKEYEKLRDMEFFSEDMFNRIIEFQERLHPAWNSALPFAERIKGLPLHALVFSNPDRDPAKCGPTIAPFYPLRGEIRQMVHCARQVADAPIVCDLHAGNGFIGSLLAREGVKVIGLRDPDAKPNQIVDFYDPDCYEMRSAKINAIDFTFDVAFSAWMPAEVNHTPHILKHRPKLIIFIHTDHVDESSGRKQTGTKAAFTELPEHYRLIGEWPITRPKDFLHEVWPELTPNIEETRHVKIFADQPYHDIDVNADIEQLSP